MDNDNLYQIESFLINFRYFSKIMHQKFNAYLKKNDVDCSEFICLLLLNREKDGLSMAELTKMSKVDKSMTTKIIKKLEEKNYIKKDNNKNRTIEILVPNEYLEKNNTVVDVPLLGKVTAGTPIEAIETPDEYFSLPTNLITSKNEIFTLKVSGESMINVGIYDGDILIVERKNTAKNGDTVVAMNSNNEATVKTFYRENGYFRLQPENDTMEPIILKEVTILGKVVGLYRKL